MAQALHHRGPDDSGILIDGSVGLVHTRLAIVDPSPLGHQPMEHPDGRWALTYNGEIFNHLDLRAALGSARFRGNSDTETLLESLAAWEESAIARCNGLFAYAALDRDRRRLLLVRDRFGVKPLYYARHQGSLWFASEMRALLEAGIPRKAVPELVRHAAVHVWVNGRQTAIESIMQVLPGTVVSVSLDDAQTSESRWFQPASVVDPELALRLGKLSRTEAAALLETELRASVRRRLMSDVPLGTMCSGGLDSSLITAFARDEQPGIRAYNASIADQPSVDESRWAERVATSLDIELRTVETTASSWRELLIETVWHNEHPLVHESSVPMLQIASLAHRDGVKVLLSGEAADELFGGYGELHLAEYADFAARRRPAQRLARRVYRGVQQRGYMAGSEDARWPAAEVEREYEADVLGRAESAYRHHDHARGRLEAVLMGDLSLYLPHLLNRQDKNTMQRSIETRTPFLDPEVVTVALNLPLEERIEPSRKGVLRDLGSLHLPADVARRPKVGFGFEVDQYIRSAMRPDFLLKGRLRDLFPVADEQWRAGVNGLARKPLLLFVTSEIWCRAFVEGASMEAIDAELWNAAA
jgi:asparagine synthase (glutamine-hydrolysing)